VSVCVVVCLVCLCVALDWRPVQGVPRLSPDDHWDMLQPPRDPTDGLSGYRKWMDGLVQFIHTEPIKKTNILAKETNRLHRNFSSVQSPS